MRQIRTGDKVRAFLDANIHGEVTEIFYKPTMGGMLMLGGVPPMEAFARVRLPNDKMVVIRTTELSIVNP
jgi:hypothetical protein